MSNKPLSKAEFIAQAEAIAQRITVVLHGEQDAFIVLEGLLRVHRFVCMQLPHDAVSAASFALAAYAGDLLKTPAAASSAPAGAPIH